MVLESWKPDHLLEWVLGNSRNDLVHDALPGDGVDATRGAVVDGDDGLVFILVNVVVVDIDAVA